MEDGVSIHMEDKLPELRHRNPRKPIDVPKDILQDINSKPRRRITRGQAFCLASAIFTTFTLWIFFSIIGASKSPYGQVRIKLPPMTLESLTYSSYDEYASIYKSLPCYNDIYHKIGPLVCNPNLTICIDWMKDFTLIQEKTLKTALKLRSPFISATHIVHKTNLSEMISIFPCSISILLSNRTILTMFYPTIIRSSHLQIFANFSMPLFGPQSIKYEAPDWLVVRYYNGISGTPFRVSHDVHLEKYDVLPFLLATAN